VTKSTGEQSLPRQSVPDIFSESSIHPLECMKMRRKSWLIILYKSAQYVADRYTSHGRMRIVPLPVNITVGSSRLGTLALEQQAP
jgi:hypothetical protein